VSVLALRDDVREVVKAFLATGEDSYPSLFISRSRRTRFHMPGPLSRSSAHLIIKRYLRVFYPENVILGSATHVLRRSITKLINRRTGRNETTQEWLGHSSTSHTRAYIDAEDYREKENGVVAALDI
jgi:integrase